MAKRLRLGLAYKVLGSVSVVTIVTMATYAAWTMVRSEQAIRNESLTLHQVILSGAKSSLAKVLWDYDREVGEAVVKGTFNYGEVIEAVVFDESGGVFLAYGAASVDAAPSPLTDSAVAAIETEATTAMPENDGVLTLSEPIIFEDGGINKVVGRIRIRFTENTAATFIDDMKRNTILLVSLLALVIMGLTWLLIRQFVTAPVIAIAKASLRITAGDLSATAPVKSDDEVGTLAENFNQMIAGIRGNVERLELLAQQGRTISSQLSLDAISRHMTQACHAISAGAIRVKVLFSEQCFLANALRPGLYHLDANGRPEPGSRSSLEALEKRHATVLRVVDPRDQRDLAAIAFSYDLSQVAKESIAAIQALGNSMASAITTVRFEHAMGMLEKRTSEMKTVFDHINQGICIVDANLCFATEYSSSLEEILKVRDLAGRPFVENAFRRATLSDEEVAKIHHCVAAGFGKDLVNFHVHSHHLPTEVELVEGDELQYIELDWDPIVDSEERVRSIMVTFREVTLLKALRDRASSHQLEMEIISQLLSVPNKELITFFEDAHSLLDEAALALESEMKIPGERIGILKRNLHTLTGIGGSLGLSQLSAATHDAERVLLDAESAREGREELGDLIAARLTDIETVLARYESIWKVKLNRGDEAATIQYVKRAIELSNKIMRSPNGHEIVNRDFLALRGNMLKILHPSLEQIVRGMRDVVTSMAHKLGRPVPSLTFVGDRDLILSEALSAAFRTALNHLLRSSFDHGLPRQAEGEITVAVESGGDFATIRYWDKGMSRRGGSMDAAKAMLEELGCKVPLTLANANEDGGGQAFEFVVLVPTQHVIHSGEKTHPTADVA